MGGQQTKQTNAIGMFIPRLDGLDIQRNDITAMPCSRNANWPAISSGAAHYHFTVKGNQATLQSDLALLFQDRTVADLIEISPADHGRIETPADLVQ